MKLSEQRIGELYLAIDILIWSWFPMMMVVLVSKVPSVLSAALTTGIAAVFLAVLVTVRKEWKGMWNKEGWRNMLMVILCITVGMYALLFIAIKMTSTGNVAILGLSEKLWGLLILGVILKHEHLSPAALLGCGLMLLGGILVLFPGEFKINWGDWMVIIAYGISTVGNIFQRRARQHMSAYQMLLIRSFIGCLILLGISFVIGESISFDFSIETWLWLALVGVSVFAIQKVCWIETIHRIPLTKANALTVVTPALSLVWMFLFFSEKPTIYQWIGLIPILIGTWLIIYKKDIFTVLKK